MDTMVLVLAPIVFASFTIGAALGFGNTVLALGAASHCYAVAEVLPILVPLNVVTAVYFAARYRSEVAWRLVVTEIFPVMGIGLCAGVVLLRVLGSVALRSLFGVFVVLISAHELIKVAGCGQARAPLSGPARAFWLLAAGLVHGMYASGGPLLVYAVGRAGLRKREFRNTLWVVWLVLTGSLLVAYVFEGRVDGASWRRFACLLPVAVLATALGEWGHGWIKERPFRVAVFGGLLLVGGALIV